MPTRMLKFRALSTRCGVEQWQLVGLITRRSQVRVLPPLPNRIHPEPRTEAVEQFLARLRFEQRDKLAELPNEIVEAVRDECYNFPSQ